jgi:hypothetical protein
MVCYEGKGVPVDIKLLNKKTDIENGIDPLITRALKVFPHCTAHGLRKAAAIAELGAPENEIMSITGHRTSKEITRYPSRTRTPMP